MTDASGNKSFHNLDGFQFLLFNKYEGVNGVNGTAGK